MKGQNNDDMLLYLSRKKENVYPILIQIKPFLLILITKFKKNLWNHTKAINTFGKVNK